MSSLIPLIDRLERDGIRLRLDEQGGLRLRGDRTLLEASLLDEVRRHKQQIVAWLKARDRSAALQITAKPRNSNRLPLSFAQHRLWVIDQLDGGSPQYNMPTALQIEGEFDEALAEEALQRIIARHEPLRTVFLNQGSEALQCIRDEVDFTLGRVDLSGLEERAQQAAVMAAVNADAVKAFDLQRDLMLRASFLRLSEERGVLLFNMHHIASDGWSMGVLIHEFGVQYEAAAAGAADPLPALPIQYADYAQWQREWLEGEVLERQLAYWESQLADLPQVHSLPLDRPRPRLQSFNGAMHGFQIDRANLAALKRLAREEGATLFMVLQGAFALLLSRYSNSGDIVMGTPVANRLHKELEGLVGFFVNTLVLRADCSADVTWREFLSHIRAMNLQAQAHQDVPFEYLVERLQPTRSTRHTPLFQIVFSMDSNEVPNRQLSDWSLRPLGSDEVMVKFELILNAQESGEGIFFRFVYNRDLFDASTMERMGAHLCRLLQGIAADPGCRIHALPMLSQDERRQLLHEFNQSSSDFPQDRCIHHLFQAEVARDASAPALQFEDQTLSYGELNARANQVAHYLIERGVGPDVLVGLCAERSLEMVIGILGILKAGGAYVPLDPAYPEARLSYMLEDSAAELVLTQRALLQRLPLLEAQAVPLDDPETFADHDQDNPQVEGLSPSNLAYVIYTSGSTGQPKGVMVEQLSVVRLISAPDYMPLDRETVFLQASSISFDAATLEIWGSLLNGGRLVLLRPGPLDLGLMTAEIERTGVNTLWLTAPLFTQWSHEVSGPSPLRWILTGGDVVDPQAVRRVYERLPEAVVVHAYGPTENTTFTCCHPVPRHFDPARPLPLGNAIKGTRNYVVSHWQTLAPVGVAGELYCAGAGVARGYLNQPELTAQRFIADPFLEDRYSRLYKTGDLVCWRADGNLEFLGRADNQVKVRGFRIELAEIEARLSQLEQVRAAAVVADEIAPGDKRLVGYVTLAAKVNGGDPVSDIRAQLKALLPEYMVPSAIVPLDQLPLTENGKLDRQALPRPEGVTFHAEYVAPVTETEIELSRIWSDVLRIDPSQLGVTLNFFELGGDSILSIQVVSRARQSGLVLTVRDLFQYPTIRELARNAGRSSQIKAPQQEISGNLPLLPIQRTFFESEIELDHFNQSILLTAPSSFDATALESAIEALYLRHDVLRLRFVNSDGKWNAHHETFTPAMVAQSVEEVYLEDSDFSSLQEHAERIQRSLSITEGPLMKAACFRSQAEPDIRLLLVIHHLVVDGVSWRILLEDLEVLAKQLSQGEALQLAPKTSSYQQWGEFLTRHAESPSLLAERDYWLAAAESKRQLPADRELDDRSSDPAAPPVYAEAALEWDQDTTSRLLSSGKAYRTQTIELLLAAFYLGLARSFEVDSICIDLEGHGREELSPELDLGQTVGWFTTIFPLELGAQSQQLKSVICSIKERYRAVPHHGIGYGILKHLAADGALGEIEPAPIAFNYLGQFDQLVDEKRFFAVAAEPRGREISQARENTHELSFNGLINDGRLRFGVTYDAAKHSPQAISRLTDHIQRALEEIVTHCSEPGAGGWTPSDFPLSRINQQDLDRWSASHRIEDLYPATAMQRGLLFHSALERGAYVTQFLVELKGDLHKDAFRRAWEEVVARCQIFRTAFVGVESGSIHQLVEETVELPWHESDLSQMDRLAQEAEIERQRLADKEAGFDAGATPLMRMRLWTLGSGRYGFLWSHHHALLDGWSLPLVLADVMSCYRSLSGNEAVNLPARRPYRDYIAWLAERDEAGSKAFWKSELASIDSPTPLPALRNRPADDIPLGQTRAVQLQLTQQETAQLERLVRSSQTTMNVVIQGAWAHVLSYYSGESRVVFGTTVSGRPPAVSGIEAMIGLFINTIPVCVDVDRHWTLQDWLRRLHQAQLARDEHAYLSLAEIISLTQGSATRGLFDSLLVFENYPLDDETADGAQDARLEIASYRAFEGTNYPMSLQASLNDSLRVEIAYQRARFDDELVERLLGQLRHVLIQMAAQPDCRLSDLPLLSEVERQQLLQEFNDSAADFPQDRCIHHLFEAQAVKNASAPALIYEDETLSYGELNARANRVAHYLIEQGAGPDGLVGLCCERSLEMVVGMLGILKAGGAYVPLDPSYPEARLRYMLEDSGADRVLTQRRLLERLPLLKGQAVLLDEPEAFAGCPQSNPQAEGLTPLNLAYLIYTSGSTGRPKGVMLRHAGAVNLASTVRSLFEVEPRSRVLQFASLSFDAATWDWMMALTSGAALYVCPQAARASGQELSAYMASRAITHATLPPALLPYMDLERNYAFEALIVAGEACEPTQAWRWGARYRMFNAYGPTESTICASVARVVPERRISIGGPINNTRLYVLNGQGQPLPIGAQGELYIGGAGVARGYLNRAELSAQRFVANPFSDDPEARLYRSGDLVRWLTDGSIEFIGRIDDQVKIRGFRIELGEVESQITRLEAVRSAVVLAREDQPGDKRLVAYVTLSESQDNSEQASQIRSELRKVLPEYMVPGAILVLDELPLTANGKVDKSSLPAPVLASQTSERFDGPSTEMERKLSEIWQGVLRVERVGLHDNFFDAGGNSLLSMTIQRRIAEETGYKPELTDIFEYPTVAALARHLTGDAPQAAPEESRISPQGLKSGYQPIAVIGMSGRFPDAKSVEQFWQNIRDGLESIQTFSDEQLLAAGLDEKLLSDPNFVRRGVLLDGIEQFDADYFELTPREAEVMDPQQRLLFECAVEALEQGGYGNRKESRDVGVFVGTGWSSYLFENLVQHPELLAVSELAIRHANDRDFVATRLSYKLGLSGPSMSVATACSTSLVAVHQACISLSLGECRMALAGGANVTNLSPRGYVYQEGGIRSADGHCRAFDAKAQGTRSGDGAGVVLLKRLDDALADGDTIQAVIRGSAVNNDASVKVGYTAPSVSGQADVIRAAHALSGIDPTTIGYVEAHGTGTKLGDPIEVSALKKAFATGKKGFCALGSVKANIGHLDAAAGIAGFIKAVQAVKQAEIPPSVNYHEPNPEIDFATSPFYVNKSLRNWPDSLHPRRAGVSSFGIGGTNAHVVLEQAPPLKERGEIDAAVHILPLSAKTPNALTALRSSLAGFLRGSDDRMLPDIAYTLQLGRTSHACRQAVAGANCAEIIAQIEAASPNGAPSRLAKGAVAPSIVFMFPGQGAQHIDMGRGLYEQQPVFRSKFDECAAILRSKTEIDLRALLYPEVEAERQDLTRQLNQTAVAQPALFAVEYSLACLLRSWGVKPDAMIGHSVGEYVAACLAGVLTEEDAVKLLAARGRLMQSVAPGDMLSVLASEQTLQPLLSEFGCSLAAVNGAQSCVASGTRQAIASLRVRLEEMQLPNQLLHTSHAFHSEMMEPIVDEFAETLAQVTLRPPQIPYLSNLSGDFIDEREACSPEYWCRHLRHTVRFASGIETLLSKSPASKQTKLLLEVGPGTSLRSLVGKNPKSREQHVFSCMRHPKQRKDDGRVLAETLGKVWQAGCDLDWNALNQGQPRRRVPLPTYPFERKRFWIERAPFNLQAVNPLQKNANLEDWFYMPSWKLSAPVERRALEPNLRCLAFSDGNEVIEGLLERLAPELAKIIRVYPGNQYLEHQGDFVIDPRSAADYRRLMQDLKAGGDAPELIIHAWNVADRPEAWAFDEAQLERNLYSLLFLSQAIEETGASLKRVDLKLIANGLHRVRGDERIDPTKGVLTGIARAIPADLPQVHTHTIDIELPPAESAQAQALCERLAKEMFVKPSPEQSAVALRGNRRWVKCLERVPLPPSEAAAPPILKSRGTYLISGGLGGIGLRLAEYLTKTVQAKLILVGRSAFPAQSEWQKWLDGHPADDALSEKIRHLQGLQEAGAELLALSADVSDAKSIQEAVDLGLRRFGAIDGVIHAAGLPGGGVLQRKTRESVAEIIQPKVKGTSVLHEAVRHLSPDFFALCSSLASFTGGFGQFEYCAANSFQDAFCNAHEGWNGTRYIAINWDVWQQVGMAARAQLPEYLEQRRAEHLQRGIAPDEGAEAFSRILANPIPQIVVSTSDLESIMRSSVPPPDTQQSNPFQSIELHARPQLESEYQAPRNRIEHQLAEHWQSLLGLDRVGIHDNFLELGGDSLLAIQVVNMVRDRFGGERAGFSVRTFFEAPTIAEIAARLMTQLTSANALKKRDMLTAQGREIEQGVL